MFLGVNVSIRLPGKSGQRFEASNLETDVWLHLGSRMTVASLEIDMDSWSRAELGLLSQVPILSPLFRDRSEGGQS